ncbi:UPF0178 protein [Spirochaetia bacterium]|nr:UPF0178 protein [Spirochaetia bacterium]
MRILVDADSCPKPVRDLVIRRGGRTNTPIIFAANRPIPGISGPLLIMELCPPGEGAADNRIVELARPGDLVITRDIPLANRLVEASVMVMDDRGRVYTTENIRERLSLRDFMVGLADTGMEIVRTPSYGKGELKKFADSFDRTLARLLKAQT